MSKEYYTIGFAKKKNSSRFQTNLLQASANLVVLLYSSIVLRKAC